MLRNCAVAGVLRERVAPTFIETVVPAAREGVVQITVA